MSKKALVLGGGGAKGSYQIGAWKAFRELSKSWDIIVGTSIGSLNGAVMIDGDYDKAEKLWKNIEYKNVFGDDKSDVTEIENTFDMIKYTFSDVITDGSYDTDLLYNIISDCISEEKIRESAIRFGLMTVEIPNMRPCDLMIEQIPIGQLCDFLMASCSAFPVFKPRVINGKKYIDGGYYDNLPVNMAIAAGADDIVAVDLKAMGFNKDLKKEESPILKIRPYWNLGAVFDFDKDQYERNSILGYNDTIKAYGFFEGMYYTFKKGECRKNFLKLQSEIATASLRVEQMLIRPVSRVLQTGDRRSIIGFLSLGSFGRNGEEMLCRVSETAGLVFKISPLEVYSYCRYNDLIIKEFLKYGGNLDFPISEVTDITNILVSISRALDNRRITALIVELMLKKDGNKEALWTLAEIIPTEFSAAVYISMLIESYGINPD